MSKQLPVVKLLRKKVSLIKDKALRTKARKELTSIIPKLHSIWGCSSPSDWCQRETNIKSAFVWHETPQGHGFWSRVNYAIESK